MIITSYSGFAVHFNHIHTKLSIFASPWQISSYII